MGKDLTTMIRSSLWIYLSSLSNNVFSLLFWLVISKLAGPSAIGYVSGVTSLVAMLSAILNLGVARGMVRWVGEYADKT